MSLKTPLLVAATAIGLTAFAHSAQAAQFNFSYISPLGTITGQIDGTVQGDNNTVVVSGITNTALNGTLTPVNGFNAYSPFFTGSPTSPVVSLSGSVMDFVACTDFPSCTGGFGFLPAGIFGNPTTVFASAGAFGDTGGFVTSNTANWQLTPQDTQATPEPGTVVALLGLGLGALASKGKKQA